jgi:alpha-L-fucosidase
MGPKRDISGELAKAVRKRGMRFVATFHHARNLQRHDQKGEPYPSTSHYQNSHYPPIEGWPTSSVDPKLRLLYGNIPEEQFLQNWMGKLKEVVDNYRPDLIWFDSWLDRIPEQLQQEFCAYYFNKAAQWGKEVVITYKQEDLPQDVGVLDLEKGRMNKLTDFTWLTDDTISKGSWCYTQDLTIKPTSLVLHVLIDIVSKNGQLLLNISPKADGTIPENQKEVLLGIGKWLDVNVEAIYNTRPWLSFGEGPTRLKKGGGFTHQHSGYLQYTAKDIRFTRSKDGKTINAILLGWPEVGRTVTIKSLANGQGPQKIQAVKLLGNNGKLRFRRDSQGLKVQLPTKKPCENAFALKITTAR